MNIEFLLYLVCIIITIKIARWFVTHMAVMDLFYGLASFLMYLQLCVFVLLD